MRARYIYAGAHLIAAYIAPVIALLLLSLACSAGTDQDSVKKMTMDNLYYAYEVDVNADYEADTSLTNILEVYSLNPEIFGDPVRIVSEFEDSLTMKPKTRQMALIVTDPTAELPAGIRMEEIKGGTVLAFSCRSATKETEGCWRKIGEFARLRGYTCKSPGIELIKEFGVESHSDTSTIELIVGIK